MESKRDLIISENNETIANLKFFVNGKYAFNKNMKGLYFTSLILIINCILVTILVYKLII